MSILRTVVLAEEQALFLDALRARLAAEPDLEAVACVQSEAVLVAAVERHQPDVVVLSDGIPSLDPADLARSISERAPRSRIVTLAGRLTPSAVVASLVSGIAGFVEKSSSFEELAEVVRQVARGEMSIPQPLLGPTISLVLEDRDDAIARRRILDRLSPREKAVLALVARGQNNESMAKSLMISPHTVKTHVQNILQKLGVHSRIAAAAFAMQEGIIDELELCS